MMVLGDLHASLGTFVKHYYGEDAWATALEVAGRPGTAAHSASALYADPVLERYVTTDPKLFELSLATNFPASLPLV